MRDCTCACTYHLGDTMATFNCQMKTIQFLNPRLQLVHCDQELATKPQSVASAMDNIDTGRYTHHPFLCQSQA